MVIRSIILMALLFSSSLSHADNLGRLFTTPAERERIDALRAGKLSLSDPTEALATQSVDSLLLNGYLRGSDGKRLTWLNGQPLDPDAPNADVVLLHDGRLKLSLGKDGRIKTLKPGQVVDTVTGEVVEKYLQQPGLSVDDSPAKTAEKPATDE